MLSEKEYVNKKGNFCPFCQSRKIQSTEHVQLDACFGNQNVVCDNCGKRWKDIYKLVGYDDYTQNDGV